MELLYSTSTTYSAITLINNRLTGGTFDNSFLPWLSYSGNNVVKRDNLYPNTAITISNSTKGIVIAGTSNSGLTSSTYTSIFAGTGNTVDYFNNAILAGENNSFSFVPTYNITSSPAGSSIIAGGMRNFMSGTTYPPEMSSILNGSGNSIINTISTTNYSDDFRRNTIINGVSNKISGVTGNSWIGNGSGNTIYTTGDGKTKGNFILNGHDNYITSSLSSGADFNTIIGGKNNSITDKNNSIVIGSGLVGKTDTTSVNNMFFQNRLFANGYTYSAFTTDILVVPTRPFDPAGKTVAIAHLTYSTAAYPAKINIANGTTNGQMLFLIGIPFSATTGPNFKTVNISADTTNVIAYDTCLNINSVDMDLYDTSLETRNLCFNYAALNIFTWHSSIAKWIKVDHRGGI